MELNNYPDSFTLIRKAFEGFFYFKLMLNGKLYYNLQEIIPDPGHTNPSARDNTLNRWKSDLDKWKQTHDSSLKNYERVLGLEKYKRDNILVIREGLPERVNGSLTGNIIPFYLAHYEDYNPFSVHVSTLGIVSEMDPYPDITRRVRKQQKYLENYFSFGSMVLPHLKLNTLASDDELERIKIHYNFLSMFVHNAELGFNTIEYDPRLANYSIGKRRNEDAEALILTYIAFLQGYYLQDFLDFLKTKKIGAWADKYTNYLGSVQEVTGPFWFIFGAPPVGHAQWSQEECKKRNQWHPDKPPVAITSDRYYDNPIEYLTEIKRFR